MKEKIAMAPMRFKEIPESLVDEIIKEYPIKRGEFLKEKQARWAKENFSPYDLGYDCNAYHYFSLVNWDVRPTPDPDTLEIFHEGVLHEPDVIDKIKSAGYKVSAINVPFSLQWGTGKSVRGKIDFFVEKDGIQIPCEAKTMAPYAFDSIDRWENFLTSKSSYHRCYPYQLMTYQHVSGQAAWGLFVLKNKVTGQIKLIKQPYDGFMISQLQTRVALVSKFIKSKKTDIEQLKNKDETWCARCDFRYQCLGDDANKMTEIIEDAMLEQMLLRRLQLKPLVSEYDKVDSTIKKAVKGKDEVLVGDFLITGKEVPRAGFTVQPTTYWKTNILFKGNLPEFKSQNEE